MAQRQQHEGSHPREIEEGFLQEVLSDQGLDVGGEGFPGREMHCRQRTWHEQTCGGGMKPGMVQKWSKVRLRHRVHFRGETGKEDRVARIMLRLTEHLLCVKHHLSPDFSPTPGYGGCEYPITQEKKLKHSEEKQFAQNLVTCQWDPWDCTRWSGCRGPVLPAEELLPCAQANEMLKNEVSLLFISWVVQNLGFMA